MSLIDDFEFVMAHANVDLNAEGMQKYFSARRRIYDLIEAQQPWNPPVPPGFGPWIEYNGENGPRVDQVVRVLGRDNRRSKQMSGAVCPAWNFGWSGIVAYCVQEEQQ
jgi:hypothetical protein